MDKKQFSLPADLSDTTIAALVVFTELDQFVLDAFTGE